VKIAKDIIEQLRVSFSEKSNLHIHPELVKFLKIAKNENCKIVGVSWLPAIITDEIFTKSDLPQYFDSWVSYDQTPRFQPFPDIIQQISQKENVKNTEHIAKIGISKIALLAGYHAQCKWNILINHVEEESDWTAYPFSHSVKDIASLAKVFQPPTKQKKKSIFKKDKS
jgi:beta-phosphoglucomutase-like phosphatase (HAD superfamily)